MENTKNGKMSAVYNPNIADFSKHTHSLPEYRTLSNFNCFPIETTAIKLHIIPIEDLSLKSINEFLLNELEDAAKEKERHKEKF